MSPPCSACGLLKQNSGLLSSPAPHYRHTLPKKAADRSVFFSYSRHPAPQQSPYKHSLERARGSAVSRVYAPLRPAGNTAWGHLVRATAAGTHPASLRLCSGRHSCSLKPFPCLLLPSESNKKGTALLLGTSCDSNPGQLPRPPSHTLSLLILIYVFFFVCVMCVCVYDPHEMSFMFSTLFLKAESLIVLGPC